MGREPDAHVRQFIDSLKRDFRLDKVILFGSRTTGTWLNDSDYDLIIVSPDFAGVAFIKRMAVVYRYWQADVPLEALCYTPEEFEKKSGRIGIVGEAIRTGIEIAA